MALFDDMVEDHVACLRALARGPIAAAAEVLAEVVRSGGRVFICGNGGSAADAQHFAAELVGRFERERRALPALALTTDSSILTALANDYGYDTVFARQLEGLATGADALVGLSTSGNSANVLNAMKAAAHRKMTRVALTGRGGGKIAAEAEYLIMAPSDNTARIQEAHIFILHYFAQIIETANTTGDMR